MMMLSICGAHLRREPRRRAVDQAEHRADDQSYQNLVHVPLLH